VASVLLSYPCGRLGFRTADVLGASLFLDIETGADERTTSLLPPPPLPPPKTNHAHVPNAITRPIVVIAVDRWRPRLPPRSRNDDDDDDDDII